MKYDPSTKTLYTDEGVLIKQLRCPLYRRWEQLDGQSSTAHRHCQACERNVLDTALLSDRELLRIVGEDPSTCLSVNTRQANTAPYR